jgi:hypothetical protein
MNETNSGDLNDFSNFHSLYFSVGHVLLLTNSFEGGKNGKVRGCHGTYVGESPIENL